MASGETNHVAGGQTSAGVRLAVGQNGYKDLVQYQALIGRSVSRLAKRCGNGQHGKRRTNCVLMITEGLQWLHDTNHTEEVGLVAAG